MGTADVDIGFVVRGFVVGLSLAAPVGPIGLLVINRTLAAGRTAGVVSGLGVATADALYGCVAGFGLTLVTEVLVGAGPWLRVIGGVFLCVLGARTFLAAPARSAAPASGRQLAGAYASILLLTLANPMTILSFVAIMAGFGLGTTAGGMAATAAFVAAVFAGSALWWLILTAGVSLAGHRLSPRTLEWINRVSGAVIILFGILSLTA
jgi:threonine/homoserine/homoserine lactone efflux protein